MKHMRNFILIQLIFMIVFSVVFFTFNVFKSTIKLSDFADKDLAADGGYFYLTIQHESNPTLLPDSKSTLDNFMDIFNDIRSSDIYTYYEIYTQPLNIEDGAEQFFLEGQGDGRARCTQVSENVLSDFNIHLDSGRTLADKDFLLEKNNSIPVLMGYNYKSIFQAGDRFEAKYLFSNYEFEIVGFLTQGCSIDRSNGSILLDECVVMPSVSFDYLPQTQDDFATHKIHYANKTSGKVKVKPEDYKTACDIILPQLNNTLVGDYSWYGSSWANEKLIFNLTLYEIKFLSKWFAIISLIISAALYIFYSAKFVNTRLKIGASAISAKISVIVSAAIILLLSNIASRIASYILVFLFRTKLFDSYFGWNILFSFAILCFVSVAAIIRSKQIRGLLCRSNSPI